MTLLCMALYTTDMISSSWKSQAIQRYVPHVHSWSYFWNYEKGLTHNSGIAASVLIWCWLGMVGRESSTKHSGCLFGYSKRRSLRILLIQSSLCSLTYNLNLKKRAFKLMATRMGRLTIGDHICPRILPKYIPFVSTITNLRFTPLMNLRVIINFNLLSIQ